MTKKATLTLDDMRQAHRYSVHYVGQFTMVPAWEVRRNAGGPSDDYDQGEWMGTFDTREAAETFAQQLRTWSIPACPRCGRPLSNNSSQQYCAHDDCHWNNDDN